jgi:hypothetical protein
MYALLKNNIENIPTMSTKVTVSFYDSVTRSQETRIFDLSLNGCIIDDSYHKICVKTLIENYKYQNDQSYLDP